MIPIEHYTDFFYSIITVIVIIGVLPFYKYRLEKFPSITLNIGSLILIGFSILMIGLRDPYGSWLYLGDTPAYTIAFEMMQIDPFWTANKDIGFYLYMKLCSQLVSINIFYLITAGLYVLLPYLSFKKWFKEYAFFALVLYISSISFWGFGINGIRNGLATSIFIYALSFTHRKFILISIVLIAISFHKSLILPAIGLIIVHFFSNTNILLRIWLLSLPLSYFFGRRILFFFSSFTDSEDAFIDTRTTGLFNASQEVLLVSSSSFRLDFIVYSALILLFGLYYKKKYYDEFYTKMYNLFIIVNIVWIIIIYAPFTNRIAYLSWFLLPIILFYPLLKERIYPNQEKIILYSILGSLSLMWILYLK